MLYEKRALDGKNLSGNVTYGETLLGGITAHIPAELNNESLYHELRIQLAACAIKSVTIEYIDAAGVFHIIKQDSLL